MCSTCVWLEVHSAPSSWPHWRSVCPGVWVRVNNASPQCDLQGSLDVRQPLLSRCLTFVWLACCLNYTPFVWGQFTFKLFFLWLQVALRISGWVRFSLAHLSCCDFRLSQVSSGPPVLLWFQVEPGFLWPTWLAVISGWARFPLAHLSCCDFRLSQVFSGPPVLLRFQVEPGFLGPTCLDVISGWARFSLAHLSCCNFRLSQVFSGPPVLLWFQVMQCLILCTHPAWNFD